MIIIDNIKIKEHRTPRLPRNADLLSYARANRRGYNLAETVFWMHVGKKKFHGIDFTRQYVIGNYIVDFYIRKLSLVIEIDGASHNEKQDYDQVREAYLTGLGLKVYRTTDWDVMHNLGIVLEELKQFIIENYEREE